MTGSQSYRQILGVRFFVGSAAEAVQIGVRGGLIVVPAAPALVDLQTDIPYRDALLDSNLAITDSGFMVLLWNLLERDRVTRVSGLEYLQLLLQQSSLRAPGEVLWVFPTADSEARNLEWLQARGFAFTPSDCYTAPLYDYAHVVDRTLLDLIDKRRPRHIIIALGGGVQEKLGHYIKRHASYTPSVHCIGAAIGFLSGDQVRIPAWADHLFLGWLFRCVSQPRRFVPRYWKARRLLPILFKYRDRLPLLSVAPGGANGTAGNASPPR